MEEDENIFLKKKKKIRKLVDPFCCCDGNFYCLQLLTQFEALGGYSTVFLSV